MRQHRLTRLLASLACLLGFFCGGFFVVPNLVLAQPNAAQALSADDLQQINEKPISANAKNTSNTGGKLSHQPAFTHTSSDGTQITEFRDAHSPTSVQVKGALGTYDMSHPSSLMPGAREPATTILSVPSLSLPLK